MTVSKNFINNLRLLVFNEKGLLSRINNLLASKNFTILNLSINSTEIKHIFRIFLEISGSKDEIDQIIKQLIKLIHVIEITRIDQGNFIETELMLVKIFCLNINRRSLVEVANIFKANILDISEEFIILEIFGNPEKILNFQKLLKNYGIALIIRTGKIFVEK